MLVVAYARMHFCIRRRVATGGGDVRIMAGVLMWTTRSNGSTTNNVQVRAQRYYTLRTYGVPVFGGCTRVYYYYYTYIRALAVTVSSSQVGFFQRKCAVYAHARDAYDRVHTYIACIWYNLEKLRVWATANKVTRQLWIFQNHKTFSFVDSVRRLWQITREWFSVGCVMIMTLYVYRNTRLWVSFYVCLQFVRM